MFVTWDQILHVARVAAYLDAARARSRI